MEDVELGGGKKVCFVVDKPQKLINWQKFQDTSPQKNHSALDGDA